MQAFRGGLAWLTIGIPTFPRKDNADYLTRTLETLLEELPVDDTDPLFARVRVLVMNNSPGNHSVFDKVCSACSGAAHAAMKARMRNVLDCDRTSVLPCKCC